MTTRKRRQHDPVYRRVFNRAQIIEEILRRYATGPWAAQLDFETLEPVPADFVSKHLGKRESDIIWRVRHGDSVDDWFFVFILMEVQSTVQRFMALRLLLYVLHLCEALIKEGSLASQRPRLLPPVLPIVLYNGERPWTAPQSLADLFRPMDGYKPPDFRYIVLDVNSYPPEELRPVEDVTAGLFLMEQAGDVEELRAVAGELQELIGDPELEADVALLIQDVAIQLDLTDEEVPTMRNLREVKMSLLQRAEKWTQEWLAEGEAIGQRLGKAGTLKNQASRRFGELPEWAMERINRADIETLDRWSYRVLDATCVEDIFDN